MIKCSFDSSIIQTNTVLSNAKLCAAAFVALDAGAGFVAVESQRTGIDVESAGFCVLVSSSTTGPVLTREGVEGPALLGGGPVADCSGFIGDRTDAHTAR